MLTADRARELFDYDPTTGVLTWKVTGKGRPGIGEPFGCLRAGRRHGIIDQRDYVASRVIWLIVTGAWPSGHIDHINRNPSDDRWLNLRDVTAQINMQNRSFTGFSFCKRTGKFKVSIYRGKRKHLGYFDTALDARAAYLRAKRILHSEVTL
jgi:HNH endonuclease